MPSLLKTNTYSLNVKVALVFFIVSIFLLSILFLLIIPKMQKEQYNYTKKQMEQMISLTKEQIQIAGKAIENQSKEEKAKEKLKIQIEITSILNKTNSNNDLFNNLEKAYFNKYCSFLVKDENKFYLNKINKNIYSKIDFTIFNKWQSFQTQINKKHFSRKNKFFFFNKKYNTKVISIFCEEYKLNPNHRSFEEDLKINIQKTFSLNESIHKGKTYLIWINHKYKNEEKPLFQKELKERKKRYTISNMSNVENITTGDLSAKEILFAIDKEAISHKIKGKKTLTWVRNLSREKNPQYIFLLITSIFEEDFNDHIDSTFWKILPAALIALFLSIIAGSFLLNRLFKGINILTHTAKEINYGNKNIRSNVKGHDDIGNLGLAFDSMLDSMQENIKNLDSKVEEKTKKLKSSLEEKEILLKEIHHRVKNNLALSIGLIKLQESKVNDKKTKKILNEIQERIYTMELLHKKLYESDNLNKIDFKDYVINLLDTISKTYNKKVKIDIKIDEVDFNIEKSMPLGLILNELITNSYKYAFNKKNKAKLLIELKKDKKLFILIVKDNGKGLDESIDINKHDSLGLKLISSIAKLQLDGIIEYKYKKGAKFIIKFS